MSSDSVSSVRAESPTYTVELIRSHFLRRMPLEALAQPLQDVHEHCRAHGFSCVEVWYQLMLIAWLQTSKFMPSALIAFAKRANIKKHLVQRKFSLADAFSFLLLDQDSEKTGAARAAVQQTHGFTLFPDRNEKLFTNLVGDVLPRLEKMHRDATATATATASSATPLPDDFKYSTEDLGACARFFAAYFAARISPPKSSGSKKKKATATAAATEKEKEKEEEEEEDAGEGYVVMPKRARQEELFVRVDLPYGDVVR